MEVRSLISMLVFYLKSGVKLHRIQVRFYLIRNRKYLEDTV